MSGAAIDLARFGGDGLITAVAQDAHTGEVRMVAHMNREALERTLSEGVAWFWSRSRGALWKKGEQSGNTLLVREVLIDCDGDAVLLRVEPAGPSCHTGAESCFHRVFDGEGWTAGARPETTLGRLEATIALRAADAVAARSYTRALLDAGATRIGAKLTEEAGELAAAIAGEGDARVLSEAADLLFHTLVALRSRGLSSRGVLVELARREGRSGIEEKASRPKVPRSE